MMTLDKKKYYDYVRTKANLTTQNVFGMEKVLDYAMPRDLSVNDLSYIIATAWWETAQTMTPVREAYWLSEAWRRKNLRYYPYYGRGLIQITWESNYRRMGEEIGLGDQLVFDPDKALEWDVALPCLFIGMEKGLYTGKKLDDYIDDIDESDSEDLREYKNARRIVNAMDKATTIGELALTFERALKKGGYKVEKKPVIGTGEDEKVCKP